MKFAFDLMGPCPLDYMTIDEEIKQVFLLTALSLGMVCFGEGRTKTKSKTRQSGDIATPNR